METIKRIYRNFRTLCRAFPINFFINGKNDNHCIMYLLYVLMLPLEVIWGIYMWVSGWLIDLKGGYKYKCVIVSIIKNEGLYLDEWIKYHYKVIGVDHFYLYNNNSTDNTVAVLKKYTDSGLVTVIELSGQERQADAYNHAIRHYRKVSKYMIVIDVDEFIQILDERIIQGGFLEYIDGMFVNNKVGGIGINWNMFGSNGLIKYSSQNVILRFVRCGKVNNESNYYIKSLINPRRTIGFFRAHAASYWPGTYAINVSGDKIEGSRTEKVVHMPIRLNHYFTKSKEEFELKRNRGMADQKGKRDKNNFEKYDLNDIYDDSMLKYAVMLDGIIEGSSE